MGDRERGTLSLQDEDRLPWLEAVDDIGDDDSLSPLRLAGFVLAGLVLLGLVIGGVWWWRNRPGPSGDGALIVAQPGDYKVKPDAPGGMTVEGEGDIVPATSEGADPQGKVDIDAVPEAPIALPTPAAKPTAKPAAPPAQRSASAAVPPSGGVLKAPQPGKAPPARAAGVAGGGSLVQLGAFNSAAEANSAWTSMSKRFQWIAGLNKQVIQAEVGGRTVHRLRVPAGSHAEAVDMCKRLKVAGQDCLVATP